MKKIDVQKGSIIQSPGSLHSKVYHVVSGLLRSYTIDEKGKEHIFMFGPEGWTVADGVSPTEPTTLFIQALENSVLTVREKTAHQGLSNATPLLKRIAVLQERVLMLMSASAIARYEHFIKTYPGVSQRVSQKMIASYLGITPEALSKLKGERLKAK